MENNPYRIETILEEELRTSSETELKIINAAIKNFAQKGFHKTKTKDISVDANVAEGTIFRYFKTKEDILSELLPLAIKIIMPRLIKDLTQKIDEKHQMTDVEFAKFIIMDRLELFRQNYTLFKAFLPEIMYRQEQTERVVRYIVPEIKKTLQLFIEQYVILSPNLTATALESFILTTLVSQISIGMIHESYLFKDDLEKELTEYIETMISKTKE